MTKFKYFRDDPDAEQEISTMPGVFRFGVKKLILALKPLVERGLKSVLLFGVIDGSLKVRNIFLQFFSYVNNKIRLINYFFYLLTTKLPIFYVFNFN